MPSPVDDPFEAVLAASEMDLLKLVKTYANLGREVRNFLAGVLPGALLQKGLLDQAITFIQACLEDEGLDAGERSSVCANLAVALMLDYRQKGSAASLEDAITAARSSAEDGMAAGDELAGRLATVAQLFALRARGFNSPADLTRAISWLQRAIQVPDISAEKAADCRSDLAGAWRDAFARDGDPAALKSAIAELRTAIRLDPSGRPQVTINRLNLAGAVRLYAVATADLTELDWSIAEIRRLGSSDPHHLYNLGLAHWERHRLTGDPDDLASARSILRQTLAVTDVDQQLYAAVARDLADTLDDGSEEALSLLEMSATHPSAPAMDRFNAATAVARKRDGDSGLPWWRLAVDLAAVLAWRGSLRRDREAAAIRFTGVAAAAAASAVAACQAEEAIEMLETGRGVLWNQLLEIRTDLERLRASRPDLAARLVEIQNELDATHHW